jgi:hypothetical protein
MIPKNEPSINAVATLVGTTKETAIITAKRIRVFIRFLCV